MIVLRRNQTTWLLVLALGMLLGWLAAQRSGTVAQAQGASPSGEPASADRAAPPTEPRGWQAGRGWGWVWGDDDEVGSLNALSPDSVRAALELVRQGRVYDLGVAYDRTSFKWPGHNPCEVMSYRSPEGVARQQDHPFTLPAVNSALTGWHSCALFISDNVGTQIDGLAHITAGTDHHWYNGFREADWGGDFGPRKCDATTIPPIIARGVLLDIAALKGVDALPASYPISPADVEAAAQRQGVELRPGDVVLVRTGSLRYWGASGADHERLKIHDTAGITLDTAKTLVAQQGAIMLGSDTSGVEVSPAPEGSTSFIPVHDYLLVEQGVHIAEFHYLEELARDQVWEFCYVAVTNKIRGTAAGFALRPLALR